MPKRKHGMTATVSTKTLAELQAKRRMTQLASHVPETKSAAKRKATEIIRWLVPQGVTRSLKQCSTTVDAHKDAVTIGNHSWRKTALSNIAMGSGLRPSQPSCDYRAS